MAEFVQSARVLSATNLTPTVRQLVILPQQQRLAFRPGQWISFKLPVGPRPPLNRAYSMAAPGTESGELTLVFDHVADGLGSSYLWTLSPGDEILLSGPHGNFTLPHPIDRELICIARFTGLVPLRCMLKQLYSQPYGGSALLLAVAPAEQELLFHQEFLSMAVTNPRFRYLPLIAAAGEQQAVELVLSMLHPLVEGTAKTIPLLCGRKGFVRPLRTYFTNIGYDRKDVRTETYD